MSISDKNRKRIFILIIVGIFASIWVYNYLTPYMSDDMFYQPGQVKTIGWILAKAWDNYMTWNGRFIPQLIMTIALSIPKGIFNILNSAAFTGLVMLMYANVKLFDKSSKRFDIVILIGCYLALWLFAISPGQTILWVAGSCNYLWATDILLLDLYIVRLLLAKSIESNALSCIGLFALGLCAGWCNENTSGGVFLLLLISVAERYYRDIVKAKGLRSKITCIPAWTYASLFGMIVGIIMLVKSPGAAIRLEENLAEEGNSGVLAYIGRLLKINNHVKNNLSIIGILLIVLLTYLIVTKADRIAVLVVTAWIATALITIYVLILSTPPMDRALFGASIITMIVMMRMFDMIRESDMSFVVLKYSILLIGAFVFMYLYISDGSNLVRINRELGERDQFVASQREDENSHIVLPMLRTEWDNRWTFIYLNDISYSSEDWGNRIYKAYYNVKSIDGITREEWEERE